MSFNVIGSLRVYLDMPRGGDPRTFLAVLYQGEERAYPFDANGVPVEEAPLEALIRSAKGARVMATEKDRLWAGTYFGAPASQILPLPPSEEARLRLLAGRARKAAPPARDPAQSSPEADPAHPPAVVDDPLWDDLDDLLSDAPVPDRELQAGEPERAPPVEGNDPFPDDLDDLLFDEPAPDAEVEKVGADPVQKPDEDDLLLDDLDAILSDIRPQKAGDKERPKGPSGLEGKMSEVRALARKMSDGILEDLPEDLRAAIVKRAAALSGSPVSEPAEADADPLPEMQEENPLGAYPVLKDHRPGALGWMADSFRSQWRHDRALSAILSELEDLRRDPHRFLRPDYYELYGVRFRKDILDPDRYVCLALTEKVEGRLRLRLVRFNEAPDLKAHHERAMRLLCENLVRFEYGPVEALFPGSIAVPPELMRAGGFEHLQDLRRWFWGADCALWVRKARG